MSVTIRGLKHNAGEFQAGDTITVSGGRSFWRRILEFFGYYSPKWEPARYVVTSADSESFTFEAQ